MAEQLFGDWAARAPAGSLTVVRPTVVFGPSNQHNVHTLLAQIAHGRSIVIGDRRNRKSLACVGNVADFLVHALSFPPGVAVYAAKPDADMNQLVVVACQALNLARMRPIRLPYGIGLGVGLMSDLIARATGRHLAVSAARVRKYRANSQFAHARCLATGFTPRHDLYEALVAVIRHEFAPETAAGGKVAFARPEAAASRESRPAATARRLASGRRRLSRDPRPRNLAGVRALSRQGLGSRQPAVSMMID
jgi:GlcNAc-P-P-Und epimerase